MWTAHLPNVDEFSIELPDSVLERRGNDWFIAAKLWSAHFTDTNALEISGYAYIPDVPSSEWTS
ncbi:hypothetical protein U6G28_05710 [Actinomycetaceae bacterium MB13-C1-2]|nr:hypothetical protein U6G28_05710 [Actinomycetaceae bacterium MB13-C1-2]